MTVDNYVTTIGHIDATAYRLGNSGSASSGNLHANTQNTLGVIGRLKENIDGGFGQDTDSLRKTGNHMAQITTAVLRLAQKGTPEERAAYGALIPELTKLVGEKAMQDARDYLAIEGSATNEVKNGAWQKLAEEFQGIATHSIYPKAASLAIPEVVAQARSIVIGGVETSNVSNGGVAGITRPNQLG